MVECMYTPGKFYVRDYAKFFWIWNYCLKYQWLYKIPSNILQLPCRDWPQDSKHPIPGHELKGLSMIVGSHPSSVCKNVGQWNVWYIQEKKLWNVEKLHIACRRDILRWSWTSDSLEREFYNKMWYRVFSFKSYLVPSFLPR